VTLTRLDMTITTITKISNPSSNSSSIITMMAMGKITSKIFLFS
jgi:hypothetical protein